jgi:hypothetical protein
VATAWDSEQNRDEVLRDGRHSLGGRTASTGVGPAGNHSGLRDPIRRAGPGTLEQRVAALEDRLNALEGRKAEGNWP